MVNATRLSPGDIVVITLRDRAFVPLRGDEVMRVVPGMHALFVCIEPVLNDGNDDVWLIVLIDGHVASISDVCCRRWRH